MITKQVQKTIMIVLIILVAVSGGFLIYDSGYFDSPASSASPTTQDFPTTQATIPNFSPIPLTQQASSNPITAPPGPAPKGKIWSPDHGHWHDIDPASDFDLIPPTTIPGQTPVGITGSAVSGVAATAGMIWSTEHEHWHDAFDKTLKLPEGELYPTPDVSTPEGKIWSPEHGHWHEVQRFGGSKGSP